MFGGAFISDQLGPRITRARFDKSEWSQGRMRAMNAGADRAVPIRFSGFATLVLAPLATVAAANVGAAYELRTAKKGGSSPQSGQAVFGNVYISYVPATGVKGAQFYMDDPNMLSPPIAADWWGPSYDLNATDPVTPYNTKQLANGSHTVAARMSETTGQVTVLRASFIAENCAAPPALLTSDSFSDGDARHFVRIPFPSSEESPATGISGRDRCALSGVLPK